MVFKLKQEIIELSDRNSFLQSEIEKNQSNPQLLLQESGKSIFSIFLSSIQNVIISDSNIGNLLKHYEELKDRNDELEFLLQNKTERGRLRKREKRNTRYKHSFHFLL